MQLISAALTDIGKVRRRNEDRFVCDDALRLYGVADGIGGLPCGAEAAELAVTRLREAVAAVPADAPPAFVPIAHSINDAVCERASRISPLGMGCTLTCGMFWGKRLHLAHVGDSRCYLFRDEKLVMLTSDHTVENDVRRRRAAGEFVLFNEAHGKALTRCIGQRTAPKIDTLAHALQDGDRYLFTTDGIDKTVGPDEIAALLARKSPPREILSALINAANARGGPDNATAVLVYVDAQ